MEDSEFLYLIQTEQVVEQLLVKQVRSYTDGDDTMAMMFC